MSHPTDMEDGSNFWPPQVARRPQNADNDTEARTPSASDEALDRGRNDSLRPDGPTSNVATIQSLDSTTSAEEQDSRHGTSMEVPRDDSGDEYRNHATTDTTYNVRNSNQAIPAIRRHLRESRRRVEQHIDGVLVRVQHTFDDLEQRIDRACQPHNARSPVPGGNRVNDRGRSRGNVRHSRIGRRSRHRHYSRHVRARHHRYQLEPLLIVELDDSFDSPFGALDWISTVSALAYEDMRRPRQRRHPRQYEHAAPLVSPDRSYHRRGRYDPIVEFHNDRRASHTQLPEDSAKYPDAEDNQHLIHPGEPAVLVGAKSMGTCLKLLREMLHLYGPRRFRHGLYQKPREAIRMNNAHLTIARNPKVVAPEQAWRVTNVWAALIRRMCMPVNRLPAGTLLAAGCNWARMAGRSLESLEVMMVDGDDAVGL
ncbi:hypothetical protein LTR99_005174 [Exophiala xenobiotica]|uniref:Uncharacterized protein n=1 Tax=Vermiconidia calcicola TaxID=1690605 RepID=A0AAV9QAF5_9PEZI|nr:hypothetical protein LTR99_005174 [Exophiala xenobiotica]KAK5436514.1 hypothetical protein LTR34_002145 [Exophiala xenobiotica]KAK5536068.1 hypothetical protein LTR25_005970 [Vermiconidia calcicola]KAK5541644.1 hypothetical protein LTR23_005733 [Chaetothyriales sp. CCFEE 6169]